MKKNNKAFTVAPWLKQLLISIVGTSIGVGLSFTVNRMVETHKQQKTQRETALMAVYDIGEILRQIKAEEEQEDRMFRATRYVMTHQEELDSISPDTLYMVIDYLFDNPAAVKGWAVDTRENTFNSSMEARRNLGDIQFYDNVQSCYQVRRELKQAIEKTQIFKRPFTSEDFENFLQQLPLHERNASASKPGAEATAKFMRMFFPSESIRVYLLRHLKRKEHFNSAIIELERLNRENKYLMNITDKDMEDYVRQNVNRTQPATTVMIPGQWELTRNQNQYTYEFNADSSVVFTDKGISEITLMLPSEKMDVPVNIPYTCQTKGKWMLKADTLELQFDSETFEFLSFDIDISSLPKAALKRDKDSLEIKKQRIRDYFTQVNRRNNHNFSTIVQFDISGNTMLWTDFKNEGYTDQLFRKEE